jgi:hypothetical protein
MDDWEDEWQSIYDEGFRDGFSVARNKFQGRHVRKSNPRPETAPKKKRRQSPKQKLLTQLTDKKWKQYRKGSGKKTYIAIRAQVSRSQDYKRKAKRLK